LASQTSSLSIRAEYQRRLLPRYAPVAAAVVCDARRVRRFLRLSTRQRTCTPARDTVRFVEQSTPAFIPPDLWPPNSTNLNLVSYKIWCDIQQQGHLLQLHSINVLKKRLCWMFGTAWTTASLTMQLASGVSVFKHMCRQKAEISSNCCKLDNNFSKFLYVL